jgi:hypothetical protein
MTLPPGRFDYAPITDRPVIKWPNNLRAHGLRQSRRLLAHARRAEQAQGSRLLLSQSRAVDHFPEVKDAMIAADWDYMAHGLYNSRPIYDYTEEQERAYWQDFITHLKEMTGKRLKGRLGGGAGYTVRTDDLMAEAGCLYHTSWIIDDQPWPINVRGGQKFIYVPTPARPTTRGCSPGTGRRITSSR